MTSFISEEPVPSQELATPDFTQKEPDIQVVWDTKTNAPFIRELESKLASCENEEEKQRLKDAFKQSTTVDFDEALEKVNSTLKEEASPVVQDEEEERVVVSKAPTTQSDIAEIEAHEERLLQIDSYVQDPLTLKFTEKEVVNVLSKVTEKDSIEHIQRLVAKFNEDMGEIARGITDSESRYHDVEIRKNAIANAISFKSQFEDILTTTHNLSAQANQITDAIFKVQFPQYIEFGPAWVLEEFYEYLTKNMKHKQYIDDRITDINSLKKIKIALYYADNSIFNHIKLYADRDRKKITWDLFIRSVFYWNIARLSQMTGAPVENTPEDRSRFDSLMLTFLLLFIRYCRRSFPELHKNPGNVQLLTKFIIDNANSRYMPEPLQKRLDSAWKQILDKCAYIANLAAKRLPPNAPTLQSVDDAKGASSITATVVEQGEEGEVAPTDDVPEEHYDG